MLIHRLLRSGGDDMDRTMPRVEVGRGDHAARISVDGLVGRRVVDRALQSGGVERGREAAAMGGVGIGCVSDRLLRTAATTVRASGAHALLEQSELVVGIGGADAVVVDLNGQVIATGLRAFDR